MINELSAIIRHYSTVRIQRKGTEKRYEIQKLQKLQPKKRKIRLQFFAISASPPFWASQVLKKASIPLHFNSWIMYFPNKTKIIVFSLILCINPNQKIIFPSFNSKANILHIFYTLPIGFFRVNFLTKNVRWVLFVFFLMQAIWD